MIKVLKDNHVEDKDKVFKVTCPHCESEFQFQVEDLKLVEKKLNGKRLIDCPCCGEEFDTQGIAVEVKEEKEPEKKEEAQSKQKSKRLNFDELMANAKIVDDPFKPSDKAESKIKENKDTLLESPSFDVRYSDIKEIEIDGEKWWNCVGYYRNREEDRKLKVGDAVVYIDAQCPDERPVMIIKKFDFPADSAARAVVGMLPIRHSDGHISETYYSDFAPGLHKYRLATDEEVRKFLIEYKEKCCGLLEYDFERLREMGIERYNKLLHEIGQLPLN